MNAPAFINWVRPRNPSIVCSQTLSLSDSIARAPDIFQSDCLGLAEDTSATVSAGTGAFFSA